MVYKNAMDRFTRRVCLGKSAFFLTGACETDTLYGANKGAIEIVVETGVFMGNRDEVGLLDNTDATGIVSVATLSVGGREKFNTGVKTLLDNTGICAYFWRISS